MSQAASTSTSAATGGSNGVDTSSVNWTLIIILSVVVIGVVWFLRGRKK